MPLEPVTGSPVLHLRSAAALLVLAVLLLPGLAAAAPPPFLEQSLELPGSPAALVSADLDGDGRRDLAVVVVYTRWQQIGIEEYTEMDQVEGLVEVLTIVPTLLDRREVRIYRGRPDGTFQPSGAPLPLPLEVITLEAGPPGIPVLALTDAGAAALRWEENGGEGGGAWSLEPVLADPPVLAGTGSFLADLDLVQDVTGDGVEDLMLPGPDGIALYRGRSLSRGGGLETPAVARVPYPEADEDGGGTVLAIPLPRILEVDGNGLPDLLFLDPRRGIGGARVALQVGPGRFSPPVEVRAVDFHGEGGEEKAGEGYERAWIGPVDPVPGAEVVVAEALLDEDAGLRKTMKQVREPRHRIRVHPLVVGGPGTGERVAGGAGAETSRRRDGDGAAGSLAPAAQPSRTFEVTGWVTSGSPDSDDPDDGFSLVLPGGFQDLNGDGRTDLVTVTNDVTVFKAMRVLATRRLTLELGFLTWCQRPDGSFVRAPGDPLTSRLTLDLGNLDVRQRSLFAGDFDGDGRRDFLQLGRRDGARAIGIHHGRGDCSHPEKPDLEVPLRDALRDLALARVLDLDGDGRDDLAITHPLPVDEAGVSPPVRLDLYVSPGGSGAGGTAAAGGGR